MNTSLAPQSVGTERLWNRLSKLSTSWKVCLFFLQDKPKCWDWTAIIKFMNAKLRWSYTDWRDWGMWWAIKCSVRDSIQCYLRSPVCSLPSRPCHQPYLPTTDKVSHHPVRLIRKNITKASLLAWSQVGTLYWSIYFCSCELWDWYWALLRDKLFVWVSEMGGR